MVKEAQGKSIIQEGKSRKKGEDRLLQPWAKWAVPAAPAVVPIYPSFHHLFSFSSQPGAREVVQLAPAPYRDQLESPWGTGTWCGVTIQDPTRRSVWARSHSWGREVSLTQLLRGPRCKWPASCFLGLSPGQDCLIGGPYGGDPLDERIVIDKSKREVYQLLLTDPNSTPEAHLAAPTANHIGTTITEESPH